MRHCSERTGCARTVPSTSSLRVDILCLQQVENIVGYVENVRPGERLKMMHVGIDPGVITGYAIWDGSERTLRHVGSGTIIWVMGFVKELDRPYKVVIEDARQRKWFGLGGAGKLQGAGSVKRDCGIWEEFLTSLGAEFTFVHPQRGLTKMSDERFKAMTKWRGSTNEHARDAAMLVYGT